MIFISLGVERIPLLFADNLDVAPHVSMSHAAVFVAQQRIIAGVMQFGFDRGDIAGHDHRAYVGHWYMDAVNHVQTYPVE